MQNVIISTVGFRMFQTEATCVTVDRANVYLYDAGVLISAYVAVVCVAITALGLGLYALKKNGHPGDTSFSGIVLATRNPTLDRICEGGRVQLLESRVKFGLLRSNERPAFGDSNDFY
ncbi:transmembrane protein, putative [Rhizoctonia solani AG-3 Rhs1AP]|uniref:Transmembrane protein, putative n=1 Tax=Rhizoctonia solani AG-3 Rhs1AP TaxID=1086054 RepID=X8J3X2_9AGAM|nr:transmembrane protein, putative [Rhizoctonia solani AG-3 Rhs1AP]